MGSFFVPVLFIIIPGVIGIKFYKTLRNIGPKQKQLKDWQDFIEIFIFSIVSYVIYGLIIMLFNLIPNVNLSFKNIEAFFRKDITSSDINYLEIIFTSIIAIILAIITAKIANKKVLFHKLKKLSNTKHYGDEDVWAHFFYSENIQWLYVRDNKLDLTYIGLLEYFSDSGEKRELVLNNVSVFSNIEKLTEPLYELKKLYLSRDDFEISIEIPKNAKNNKEESNGRNGQNNKNAER